ncbi:uncharacterized protein BO80DRAFT_214351 [Aspergillus ibericus CBS 121593]|uniref:Uncharacterized protein n=1 Tax=Aspergillus ibericus CBS 121593 TaxID=1448316 RepID=A0A395GNC5_9EURO|nr:hypothetical protein BO80DRAFT_214351 [Aspergillus ibericus CBS 121593]RAK96884.1 hypothetical protein BO80DRAFT_214351 [Aspergillus ibericus CBS 121593]
MGGSFVLNARSRTSPPPPSCSECREKERNRLAPTAQAARQPPSPPPQCRSRPLSPPRRDPSTSKAAPSTCPDRVRPAVPLVDSCIRPSTSLSTATAKPARHPSRHPDSSPNGNCRLSYAPTGLPVISGAFPSDSYEHTLTLPKSKIIHRRDPGVPPRRESVPYRIPDCKTIG